jgi:hypothetical protein
VAKFIKNISSGIVCFGPKNFIPGAPEVGVTNKEANHKLIKKYVDAGKLQLIETVDKAETVIVENAIDETADKAEIAIDDMSLAQLKEYVAEHNIDLGGVRTKPEIIAKIKAAKAGE